jgi:sulfur carrier protein
MPPVTIILNGEPRQARPDSTVAELLTAMEIAAKHVAVEVNLEIVPRSRHAEHRLQAGDRVEVVTLVGGG